ncbi:MAG: NAD-dependent epimerase/dehydratase family protein [Paracoccaceae bacterium]
MSKTVLILGASGKIGRHAASAFWNAGWKIRKYDRKAGNMIAAAKGVDVIVNGLNPPNYNNWAKNIPEITRQVIAAAMASGATVIIPGNVYNFGDTPGVWSEDTPQRPVSRKGKIRVEMENAYRASGVQTIILRAGNFIDPEAPGDVFDLIVMRGIAKGKLTLPGKSDALQPYAYLPDWAAAAAALADKRETLATFEDVPFPGRAFTMDEFQSTLEQALDRKLKVGGFPWWLFSVTAPFWELARELKEMRYLWDTSHSLSSDKFDRLLPDFPRTDIHTVMTSCLPADINPNQTVPGSLGVSAA